jgi:predicted nucleotidyltransferase
MKPMVGAGKIHPRSVVDGNGRKAEIVEKLKSALRDTEGIAFAYLFGSFLNQETFRDIDLGIYLDESSYRRRTEIVEELYGNLEGVFEPVDIRILNEAPPSFLYHVLRGELLGCVITFRRRSWSRFPKGMPIVSGCWSRMI